MAKILNQLQLDHKNMDRLLRKLTDLLDQEASSGYEVTKSVIHYMTHYPDVVHHPTEDLMFEHLIRRDQALQRVVDKLIAEHEGLAETGRLLLELASAAHGDSRAADTLRQEGHSYIVSLRQHMSIEESQVFPHARVLLTERDWTEIDAKRRPFADPLFGDTILEGYRHIYEALAR